MKFVIDTHMHTIPSGHAYSTIREMAEMGKEHGLEAIVLTEHGPEMPGSCMSFYFENTKILPRERYGIQMFFGVELNILNANGDVDLPERILKRMDLTIASLHTPCFHGERSKEEVTKAYVNAMKNPYINVIGHPDDSRFPIDYEVLVKTAKETGKLLEINNSSMREDNNRENAVENIKTMLKLCKEYRVPVVAGSDAHIDLDVGKLGLVESILAECEFPEELVVSTDLEKIKPFMNRFKKY